MSKTLIFGGSGKVAQHLTKLLVSAKPPHQVYSVIRNQEQYGNIKQLGAEPILQSIEESSVDDFVSTLQKHNIDTVVWSAGAGGKGEPSRTQAVDQHGAIKSFDAAAKAGVKRYVLVSAIDVRDLDKPTPEWYTDEDVKRSEKGHSAIGAYMKAKLEADKELRTGNDKRKLNYTIIRPGSLSDAPSIGSVSAGKVQLSNDIPREDVAKVIFEVLKNDGTFGLAFDVVSGQLPIDEAIKKVADEKIDTFEGYY